MDLKQVTVFALQVSVICTVFGFGLNATAEDLLYVFRRPGLLLRSLVAVFVIMPIVAAGLVMLFPFRPTLEVVLVSLALSPVPPLLPSRQAKGGGRSSYGLGLMAVLGLLSIAVVPLGLELVGLVSGRSLGITTGAIARIVLVMTILPLLGAMALRALLPGAADRLGTLVAVVVKILLPLAVLVLLAGSWQAIWAAVGDGSIIAMTVFVCAGLLVGHLMGGPDPENAIVLALSTACRHPAIALSIAASNFPDQQFGGTILLYLLVNLVVALPYLARWRPPATSTLPA